jgi:hypothetical protein
MGSRYGPYPGPGSSGCERENAFYLKAFIDAAQAKGLVAALTERDGPFGDYRTTERHEPSTG